MATAVNPGLRRSKRAPKRLPQLLEPHARAHLAHFFFYLFDAAEFDARGASGLGRGHSGTEFLVGEQIEVATHFRIEIAIRMLPAEQISNEC
jgi:hypothetical protein